MQAALVILALSSISATLSAETGSPLAPDRPVAGSLNDALTPTPSFVTSETEFFLKSHGTSRRVLRRKDSLMSTVLAAAASAAAILAVAFLVLQCFKALGKASRAAYSSRRLANSNKGSEGLDCGYTAQAGILREAITGGASAVEAMFGCSVAHTTYSKSAGDVQKWIPATDEAIDLAWNNAVVFLPFCM
ncbi:hypothetical protein Esti_005721 [Eimeria stiedai]